MSKALENLRKNLALLLEQQDWSQAELARRSAVPQPHISQYVLGKTKPGIEALESLAAAFGVPLVALLGNEVPRAAPPPVAAERARLEALALLLVADDDTVQVVLRALRRPLGGSTGGKSKPSAG